MQRIIRKKEEKKFKHNEILKFARDEFNKNGFIKTTIGDIAKQSGYSVGTIYNFFTDKENLFAEILKIISSKKLIELQ